MLRHEFVQRRIMRHTSGTISRCIFSAIVRARKGLSACDRAVGQFEGGVKVMTETVSYSKCMDCKYVSVLSAEHGVNVDKGLSGLRENPRSRTTLWTQPYCLSPISSRSLYNALTYE